MSNELKQIKIKTGTLRRTVKELDSYRKEAEQFKAKVAKLKADGADSHTVAKQEEVYGESEMMIQDTLKRLENAYADLQQVVDASKDDSSINAQEDFTNAVQLLQDVGPTIGGGAAA